MSPFPEYRIHPLTEAVINGIVEAAGGRRAHPDHDRRSDRNADYIIGRSIVELKILEDEGLSKKERQRRLADLFVTLDPDRPVIVVDREYLDEAGRRAYDRAFENTFKSAVASAKKQLRQSRTEHEDADRSILMIVNNANTALDHDEIVALVGRRARNDTREIDGVVVAGCYQHGDGFESGFLWPMTYVPIAVDRPFREYEKLREAFNSYATRVMTAAINELPEPEMTKGAVLDTFFDLDGKRFVKPAPPMGKSSEFFVRGRPRANSTGIDKCPTVAIIYPELTRSEWSKLSEAAPRDSDLGDTYEAWLKRREGALATTTALKPVLPISVTIDGWLAWIGCNVPFDLVGSITDYAHHLFEVQVKLIIEQAHSADTARIMPPLYMVALTELIGQDEANDVSHIAIVRERPGGETEVTSVVENLRIFHLHAVCLAAAYAIRYGVEHVLWRKDLRHAWT